MIDQVHMMEVIQKHRGDAVIVTVERASMAWPKVSTMPTRDVSPTVMGKGSSFALGVSLAQPDTKVIVLDGDGSLLMNLGTLTTVGNMQPRNLYHFVLENGMYATTGGQPIPGQNVISFAGMAKDAGYAKVYNFNDLEDFDGRAGEVFSEDGPALICVKTVPNPRLPGQRPQESREAVEPFGKRCLIFRRTWLESRGFHPHPPSSRGQALTFPHHGGRE